MSTIIFSHGKESGPNGHKISILREVAKSNGYETIAVDYTNCLNAKERIQLLEDTLKDWNTESIILVGSSMGGYVSTVTANKYNLLGLFLLCPALFMPEGEYETQDYYPKCETIEIIHGWEDEVVPYANSIRFGKQTKAILNLVDDNHRLTKSYEFIKHRFEEFLKRL
jgi:pimeloyl-ACP methyl ester carboxylesterase